MILKEYDIVALKSEIQAVHKDNQQPILLQSGQVGTVVMNFNNEAYLIDFSDVQGRICKINCVKGQNSLGD